MALLFDADTEVVNCGSDASLDDLDPFAACAWAYRTANAFNQVMIGKGTWNTTGWSLLCDDNNGSLRLIVMRATTRTEYKAAIGSVQLNGWTFVAVSFDESATPEVHLYYANLGDIVAEEASYQTEIDGAGAINSDASQNFEIGLQTSGGNNNWDGRIGRVAAYSSVLSLGAFRALQYAPRRRWNRSDCVGLWELDRTGTVPDLSGNGNNGTVTGATIADHVPLGRGTRVEPSVPVAVSAQTILAGLALVTDTALALGILKSAPVGLATESDSALAVVAAVAKTVGLAAEQDLALGISWARARAIALSTEQDLALVAGAVRAFDVGLTTEQDLSLAITAARAYAAGLATEQDLPLVMTWARAKALGLVTETDLAPPVAAAGGVSVGLTTETDLALAASVLKSLGIGLATETDSVFGVVVVGPVTVVVLFPPDVVDAPVRQFRVDAPVRQFRVDAPERTFQD